VPGAPAAPGVPPPDPAAAGTVVGDPAPGSTIGNAPPWLQTQQAKTPVGNVTLTSTGYQGLPEVNQDFSGAIKDASDAAYKGATQYFDEDFARNRAQLETQLTNQGFMRGTEAYDNALSQMERGQNAARENAGFQAQAVGNAQAGDLLTRALTARAAALGERNTAADRAYAQSMGVAGLGLTARGQDTSADSSFGASKYASDAATARADDEASIALQRLGLDANSQDFAQMMQLIQASRGGVNMPNFGTPAPLDVASANQIASGNANNAANRDAADRAGLYGLGAAALGGLGQYYGAYG
jgi:hypothetical protein